jgi:hypothetical protein
MVAVTFGNEEYRSVALSRNAAKKRMRIAAVDTSRKFQHNVTRVPLVQRNERGRRYSTIAWYTIVRIR